MFSFTKVESWRNVSFLPKCTRSHQTATQISKFSLRRGHPLPIPLPTPFSARRFAHQLVAFGHSMHDAPSPVHLTLSYSPSNKQLDKALQRIRRCTHVDVFGARHTNPDSGREAAGRSSWYIARTSESFGSSDTSISLIGLIDGMRAESKDCRQHTGGWSKAFFLLPTDVD